jgi:ATP-dependent RNA helicase DDX21
VLPYEPRRASLASIFESEDEEVIEVDGDLADESLRLENCGLRPETVAALQARGIHALFPIQKHVFEPSRAGRDLIGRARTGSGKTLAFSLPIIEGILEEKEKHAAEGTQPPNPRAPRCIVLAPTRELAKQVEREMAETAPGLALGCFYGGVDIGGQIRQLRRGCDAVVGTPGRVIDLIDRGALDLSSIKFFVLDEADMMLNVGFEDDVERILESVPSERQTLLFSATMPA